MYLGTQEIDSFSFGQADGWIIDSASTCHVTNNREYMRDFETTQASVTGMGGQQAIEGRGTVILNTAQKEPTIHANNSVPFCTDVLRPRKLPCVMCHMTVVTCWPDPKVGGSRCNHDVVGWDIRALWSSG